MPWQVGGPVSERKAFIRRLEGGERMSDLCREYGISRKTGYKFRERFRADGEVGLEEQSRSPKRSGNKTSEAEEALVLTLRRKYPTWGPKKVHARLKLNEPGLVLPSVSTMGLIMKRHGLVEPRRKRVEVPAYDAPLRVAHVANEVWCTDFKGQFRLGTRRYCYPLTVSDRFSRMLLGCEALEGTDEEGATEAFLRVFEEYGLPEVIRSDNGVPFASRGMWGLSKLAVLWIRLGIMPERIDKGCPEQNGQHERMHRVLKAETTRPAAANQLAQQERFDAFKAEYNEDRPHEGIGLVTPLSLYEPSRRLMPQQLPELTYPLHDDSVRVDASGHVRVGLRYVFLTTCLATQHVGVRELADGTWTLAFGALNLGSILPGSRRFVPAPSPFGVHAPIP